MYFAVAALPIREAVTANVTYAAKVALLSPPRPPVRVDGGARTRTIPNDTFDCHSFVVSCTLDSYTTCIKIALVSSLFPI